MLQIANPIYDVVFKYLLEDSKVAKYLISKIIGQEIAVLEFLPQKQISDSKKYGVVYELDFQAKIKTENNEIKQVLIEIQKAKFPTDIIRFRKYLGLQYEKTNLPIITIYFLGHRLKHLKEPIISVTRTYKNCLNNTEISQKEEFVESLTHDSYIIQIPYLKQKRQTEIEKLLSIFDQSNITNDEHILNIKEENYDDEAQKLLIRRLQRAIAEPEMKGSMDIEDRIFKYLDDLDRNVEIKEEIIIEKDKKLEENKKILEKKDKVLEEKDKVLEENKKVLEENKKKLEEQENLIKKLQTEILKK